MMLGLNQIMILNGGQSRSITGENKEGKKGAGGQASGDLGKGRKGSPCTSLPMGKTTVLADIEGPGTIQHIFFTVTNKTEKGCFVLRDLVLRVYWDEEKSLCRVSGWRFLLLWLWRRLYSKFFTDSSKSCKGISLLFSNAI